MSKFPKHWTGWILIVLLLQSLPSVAAAFRVATFNVENYIDVSTESRRAKVREARAAVVESLLALNPDVVALQEIGSTNALLELQNLLAAAGLKLPYWECVSGADTNIHVCILSRFELIARRPHTNESYLLNGRRFRVSRGIAEVDVRVTEQYQFTLIAVHLKSRLPSVLADEDEMREQEAMIVRKVVEQRMAADPKADLVVVGDFNDSRNSKALRAVVGRGKAALFDTHPTERNCSGQSASAAGSNGRPIAWTYYYSREDVYSRIDYILLSPAMKRRWLVQESFVLSSPNWGTASDHRPILCGFEDSLP